MNMNKITYLELIKYLHESLLSNRTVDEIRLDLKDSLIEIPEENIEDPLTSLLIKHRFIGQKHYDFSFRESSSYWGQVVLDYIDGDLLNIKAQLFADGFIPTLHGLIEKERKAGAYLTKMLGKKKVINFQDLDLPFLKGVKGVSWTDNEHNLFATLNNNKSQSNIRRYISVGIEKMMEKD